MMGMYCVVVCTSVSPLYLMHALGRYHNPFGVVNKHAGRHPHRHRHCASVNHACNSAACSWCCIIGVRGVTDISDIRGVRDISDVSGVTDITNVPPPQP